MREEGGGGRPRPNRALPGVLTNWQCTQGDDQAARQRRADADKRKSGHAGCGAAQGTSSGNDLLRKLERWRRSAERGPQGAIEGFQPAVLGFRAAGCLHAQATRPPPALCMPSHPSVIGETAGSAQEGAASVCGCRPLAAAAAAEVAASLGLAYPSTAAKPSKPQPLAQAYTGLCSPSVRAASRRGFTVVPRPQQAQGCSLGSSVMRFWCVGGASRLGSNAHAAPAQPQPTGHLYQPSLYSKGSTSALGATVTSAAAAPPSSVGTGSGGCCASVFLALSRTSTKLPLCPGT